jgi:hypothetical protein
MKQPRNLREDEKALIADLIRAHDGPERLLESLADSRVEDMEDGGMGGVRFFARDGQLRHFGTQLLEVEFLDADGVALIVAINLDGQGELYELDLWKVDFSPLIRFPSTSKKP